MHPFSQAPLSFTDEQSQPLSKRFPKLVFGLATLILVVAGGLLLLLGYSIGLGHRGKAKPLPPEIVNHTVLVHEEHFWPVFSTTNVNFGGWLCLEDWFYSGNSGRYVSTPDDIGQGACLPPGVTDNLDEPWPSEAVLVQRLVKSVGEDKTIDIFKQHRETFITDQDLDDVASLGIKMVRVPLTWVAFADALSRIDKEVYNGHNPDTDSVIIPDPYYVDLKYVTLPRKFLADFLRKLAAKGLKALLDLHGFPAGSSNGTYNGIWPFEPVFWSKNAAIGNKNIALVDAGQWIVEALIQWVDQLDPQARMAVGGITVMNEPAHLMAGHVEAAHVLNWIGNAANAFRKSYLPARGVKLYVNLIETAFEEDFMDVVGPWWDNTFSEAERNFWAVMDIHHYLAWGGNTCEGRIANVSGGGYKCTDPIESIRTVLEKCLSPWATRFAKRFSGLKACTEFSLGTCQDALAACSNQNVLSEFFSQQMAIMQANDIEPFFWTWRMPYGPKFEAGWSFKKFVGLEKSPDNKCQMKDSYIV